MGLGDTEPDTLRSDLEAAFAAPTDATPIDTPDPSPAPAETSTAPTADTSGDRPRGPDGKFIAAAESTQQPSRKAEGAATPPTAKATPAPATAAGVAPSSPKTPPSTDAATKASDTQPSTAADAPPVGWTADAKAEWPSLSPAIKAAVLKREVEMSSGGRQWSDEKRRYEAVVAPVRERASRKGMSESEAIQSLLNISDRFDQNPARTIEWLAQAYNVPITVNGQQPATGSSPADGSSRTESSPTGFDPRSLSPLLSPLERRLDAIQARFAAEDQRQTETTVRQVEAFASDPSHPHFDAVSDELMAMLPLLKSANPHATPDQLLQDAYDRAVRANPQTWAAVQAQANADADAARRAKNSADVGKARLASSSIRGTAPVTPAANGARDSIREELEAAWAARA